MAIQLELFQIVADTLLNNHFDVVTNVPGFGGTQVFERMQKASPKTCSLCLNEEAAFSIATGAALFGTRSATLVKTHGLAKMANALCSTLSVGTNAANLIFAFDDTTGKSSDNIFNAKGLISGLEAPFLVLNENAEESIIKAIELSEQLQLPVIVYVDCEKLNQIQPFHSKNTKKHQYTFTKHPNQYVACPPLSKYQREILLRKLDANRPSTPLESPDLSKLIPNALPPHLKVVFESYGFFFETFSKLKVDFASGDAGTSSLYAFQTTSPIDACTYMGGAPGMALGAYLGGAKRSWAFTGDFSFLAAGILGFNEIISRSAPIKLVIFENGIAGATGGQSVPSKVLGSFKKAHQDIIHTISPKISPNELLNKLERINEANQAQIVLVDLT